MGTFLTFLREVGKVDSKIDETCVLTSYDFLILSLRKGGFAGIS